MNIQTCIAGRNLPERNLLRKILEGRGHQVHEVANPAQCFIARQGQEASGTCKLIVAEYTGAETADMIDYSIERAHVSPNNIIVLANGGERDLQDVQDLGCHVKRQPLQPCEFVEWIVASERRCAR